MKLVYLIKMLILVLGGNVVISFENDYLEGAHEKVLKRLVDTNLYKLRDMALINSQLRQLKRLKIQLIVQMLLSVF